MVCLRTFGAFWIDGAWDRQPRLAAKCLRPFGTVEPIRVRPFGTVETIIQGASQSSGLGAATGFLLGKGMSGWFGVAHHFDIGLCFQIDVG